MSADCHLTEADFIAAFDHAEKVLKRFERLGGETLDTAINQLRYSARHYLDGRKNPENADDEIKDAVAHCRRAEFDAIEASIAVIGTNIIEFDDRFLESSIEAIIPKYPDYYAKAKKLLAKLDDEESVRNVADVDLSAYGATLDELVEFWVDVSAKLPLVRKIDLETRLREKISTRRHVMNALLTILGIAVAVAFGVIAKWF